MYGSISCCCSRGDWNKLVNELAKKVEALKVGPGMDKQSEMGPLVTKEHLEKVKSYVNIGEKKEPN